MIRKSFKMHLKSGFAEEYQKRHDDLWEDMKSLLKEHGVHNYSIFLDSETNTLYSYVEIDSETKWNTISETETCRTWWDYMKDIMLANDDNSPVSTELKSVFYLK